MLLTTKGRYAIIACIDLAKMITEEDKKISVYQIAEKQRISIAYLEQIFSKLRQANIVSSTKGPNGGYLFAKNIQDIKLLDIIKAVDENIKMTNCEECKTTKRIDDVKLKCDGHTLWKALGNHINNFFENITLEDAVNNKFNNF
jgi:Rrf2 family iron-sulfur cluster assembly transcriptional regulator